METALHLSYKPRSNEDESWQARVCMRLVLSTLMSRSNENKSCGRVDERWRGQLNASCICTSHPRFIGSLHAETRKIFTTLLSTSTASRNLRLCKQGLILLYWGEGVRYFARLKTRIARLSISNKSQFRYRSLYHKACKRKSILSIHLQLTRWTVQLPNQISRFLGTICLTFNCALPPPPPRKRIHSCVRYYYVAFALCFVLCFNENSAYHARTLAFVTGSQLQVCLFFFLRVPWARMFLFLGSSIYVAFRNKKYGKTDDSCQ
jgi:hypothetical protein